MMGMFDEDEEVLKAIADAIKLAKKARGESRSDRSRVYAITVTELEKAYAYLSTFVKMSD